jgi:hypothetical protein
LGGAQGCNARHISLADSRGLARAALIDLPGMQASSRSSLMGFPTRAIKMTNDEFFVSPITLETKLRKRPVSGALLRVSCLGPFSVESVFVTDYNRCILD